MPTLFRLLIILSILSGIIYASLFALATYLSPEIYDIVVMVPIDRLNR